MYQEAYVRTQDEGPSQGWRLHEILPATHLWLESSRDKRFFLFLHSFDVHEPFVRHSYLDEMEPRYTGVLSAMDDPVGFEHSELRARFPRSVENGATINQFILNVLNPGRMSLSESDRSRMIALYDNEIRFVDDSFCHVLDWLDEFHLADRTIVALTSDHGEELFERGRVQHGGAPYDELIHIPLIMRVPGLGRATTERLAQGIDIAPTLLSIVGVPKPAGFQGRDLLSVDTLENHCVTSQTHDWSSARSQNLKLILEGEDPALYDLRIDPQETTNLARERPLDAARLKTCLKEAIANSGDDASEVKPSKAHLEGLRALGYLN